MGRWAAGGGPGGACNVCDGWDVYVIRDRMKKPALEAPDPGTLGVGPQGVRKDLPATAVVIVGGGLSGLAAAVQLGRLGVPTIVFDQANDLGGRAMTEVRSGFHLNFGPHRLYEKGAAVKAFREL